MTAWEDEYRRRVVTALAPEHAAHGWLPHPDVSGSDPSGCDTCGGDGWMDLDISGTCPCGKYVAVGVRGPEDFAKFFRKITDP